MQSCYQGISPVSLRKLFPAGEMFGGEDYTFLNCTTDPEKVRSGDAFVAFHPDQIDEAIARGAGAIVSQEMTDNPFRMDKAGRLIPFLLVENAARAYAEICEAMYRFPGSRMELIAVTGTSGKTMTSCLIAGILGAAGHGVGMLGSLGGFDGMDASPSPISTLPPKRLSSWLSRMEQNECSHAIVEVSSQALEQYRLEGLRFGTVCMTNIHREHLDLHGTVENYRKIKMRIFEYLAKDGVAILNADDPILADVTNWLDIPALTYGLNEETDITAIPIDLCSSEQTILLTAGSVSLPLRTKIIGNHFLYDVLAAVTVGLRLGIDLETVVRGVESVHTIPGRMERIECGQPFGVFLDFAHTPLELRNTLESLREVTSGKLICVFGGKGSQQREQPGAQGNMDPEKQRKMGRIVRKLADRIVLTDACRAGESPDQIIRDFLSGMKNTRDIMVYHRRRDAICYALSQAEPGDCVLVIGRGHEKFQTPNHHDDRDIVRRWLFRNVGNAVR